MPILDSQSEGAEIRVWFVTGPDAKTSIQAYDFCDRNQISNSKCNFWESLMKNNSA